MYYSYLCYTNTFVVDESNAIFQQHSSRIPTSRTLLSQLQDEGSSSNDSSFVLTKNIGKTFNVQSDKSAQSAKESSPKEERERSPKECQQILAEQKSQSRGRMDIFSTAIASADINLDTFEYLEDGMISADDMFTLPGAEVSKGDAAGPPPTAALKDKSLPSLEQQLHQLLGDDNIGNYK